MERSLHFPLCRGSPGLDTWRFLCWLEISPQLASCKHCICWNAARSEKILTMPEWILLGLAATSSQSKERNLTYCKLKEKLSGQSSPGEGREEKMLRAWGSGGSSVSSNEPWLKREKRSKQRCWVQIPSHTPHQNFYPTQNHLHCSFLWSPAGYELCCLAWGCFQTFFLSPSHFLSPRSQTSFHPRPYQTSPDLLLLFPAAASPFLFYS